MGIFGLVQPCYMGVCTGATTRATHRHGPLPGVQQGRAQGIDGDPGCEHVDQDELATGDGRIPADRYAKATWTFRLAASSPAWRARWASHAAALFRQTRGHRLLACRNKRVHAANGS